MIRKLEGSMHDKLLIIGAGGHGKVCADIAIKMNKWSEISFLDSDMSKNDVLGLKIKDSTNNIELYVDQYDFFVAVGDNQLRQQITFEISNYHGQLVTLIHPSANIGFDVKIGSGTVIMPGVSINPGTVIENGVIINTNASVDHDCKISNFVHISPGVNIAGTVSIGRFAWLGVGSTVINNIKIEEGIIVGAGATVIKNLLIKGTYVGTPAIKNSEE